jgi:Methyltransferase small domain
MKTIDKATEVKKIIQDCKIQQEGKLYSVNIIGETDRAIYNEVKEVFKRLDINWNSRKKQHFCDTDPKESISLYLDSGYLPPLNPFAYFPTPTKVVEEAIELTNIPTDSSLLRFLEPSAGCGQIATAVRLQHPHMSINCIEIDSKNRGILIEKGFNLVAKDFEIYNSETLFDIVIMNPPFNGKTYQKHILKAWDMLRTGGSLTAIVPFEYRRDTNFANWVFEFGYSHYIGRVFQNTKVECEIIVLTKDACPFLWEPVDGFESHYHRKIQIFIDSDCTLSQLDINSFDQIDEAIIQEINSGSDLIWNDKTKSQVKHYLSPCDPIPTQDTQLSKENTTPVQLCCI